MYYLLFPVTKNTIVVEEQTSGVSANMRNFKKGASK
jgi:hypothetical protein